MPPGSSGSGLLGLSLPGVDALLDPVALTLLGAVVLVPVLAGAPPRRRGGPRVVTSTCAWGCGGVRVSPRMQYTATSYAEPLVRVFDDALQPERDLEVTHLDESQYLVGQMRFRQRVDRQVAERVYGPIARRAAGHG